MQCKCITLKCRAHDRKRFEIKHGSTVKLMLSRVWIYIAATINRGIPKQIFAQGNPTSAITHAFPKTLNKDCGAALGFHGGRQWRTAQRGD